MVLRKALVNAGLTGAITALSVLATGGSEWSRAPIYAAVLAGLLSALIEFKKESRGKRSTYIFSLFGFL